MQIQSKLPNVGTTIFTVMSALANKHQAINLSQGFPNFDCPNGLKELVAQYMRAGKNQYAPMAGALELREVLAAKIESMYGLPVNPMQEITVTAGATQAIFTAITALVHPGDEVVIIEPAYDCYQPAIELAGAKTVVYELTAPAYRVDWAALGALINEKTRMLIVNTPHNPTGQVFEPADLDAMEVLLERFPNLILLSDEVYEHLIYDGRKHQSALGRESLKARSLATFSFGKTFHNTGWKVGYCVAPEYLMKEFRKVHQFNVFSVNTPMQLGLAKFLETPSHYLELPAFYGAKRDLFDGILKESRFQAIPSQGTYFQLASYQGISEESDVAFAKQMTKEHGVAVIPISVFYSSGRDERILRFCYAKTEDLLEAARERLILI